MAHTIFICQVVSYGLKKCPWFQQEMNNITSSVLETGRAHFDFETDILARLNKSQLDDFIKYIENKLNLKYPYRNLFSVDHQFKYISWRLQ